jgi:hypothetical protein
MPILVSMNEDERPLPTAEHVTRQYREVRPLLKVMGLFDRGLARQAEELEAQFEYVQRMQRERVAFAARFGPLGWTNYDRLSVDIVALAIAEGDDEAAEQLLAAHHLDADTLQFLGHRFHVSRFEAWQALYERAVERALAQDYLSAVPLVLIIIDGVCTTKTGKHPFSGGADAPVFDSQTSGPGGIAEGLAILGATRRKLDTEPIRSPYRHGILHGLNPSFDNPLVAAKAFNLLQASVDYFDRREDEEARIAKAAAEQRPASWSEMAATMASTRETSRRIDAWQARPERADETFAASGVPHDLDPDSPEGVAAVYLAAIVARNFGEIAKATIDYPCRPIGFRAGRHRDELGDLRLTDWRIIGVRDEAPAISVVNTFVSGTYRDSAWSGEQTMRLVYVDAKYDAMVRDADGGSWSVMPNYLNNLWGTATRSMQARKGSEDES